MFVVGRVRPPMQGLSDPLVAEMMAVADVVRVAARLHDVNLPGLGPVSILLPRRKHPDCCVKEYLQRNTWHSLLRVFLPGQIQSPLGSLALTSTRPYLKLNPMLERIRADWIGLMISPFPAVLEKLSNKISNLNKSRITCSLQKGVKQTWGPKPTYIQWIYTAIVCPKLTYAALSWSHITCFPPKHAVLDKLNRLATTLITPVRKSTPIKTMEILYNLIPLHLFLRYEAIASLSCNTHCLANS